ncbi:MAG TPA: methyltransferase domain-containing protein [Candidatus Acidoferrales bacterium]|nr:methyltransferase domain-containing protein [Candidatus Acidoferrales bacterium]
MSAHANASGGTALIAGELAFEKKISELEGRIRELEVRRSGPPDAEWRPLARTIDAILRQLTHRVLKLEKSQLQLRNLVLAQNPAEDAGHLIQIDQALRAAHIQLAALKNRLCDYEVAVRTIKNLSGQVGATIHERHQPKSAPGPRFVPLKAKGCTEEDMNSDWAAFWAGELRESPKYKRKLWELCYVSQVLYNEGMLQQGKMGLGFACGSEPLPSLFAKYGVRVLATDLSPDRAEARAWMNSGQHVAGFENVRRPKICPDASRLAMIRGAYLDMNAIPAELDGQFDFCWSVCSLEHLGSIANGLKFIANSLRTLKPGGVSVHTAEFNLNEGKTITAGPTVLFQRHHFEQLAERLRAAGFHVYDFDFDAGRGIVDGLIDLPPYDDASPLAIKYAHLKLSLSGFVCTSFSFVVKKLG